MVIILLPATRLRVLASRTVLIQLLVPHHLARIAQANKHAVLVLRITVIIKVVFQMLGYLGRAGHPLLLLITAATNRSLLCRLLLLSLLLCHWLVLIGACAKLQSALVLPRLMELAII